MALLEREEEAPSRAPKEISDGFDEALTFQFIRDCYDKKFEAQKGVVVEHVINHPDLMMKIGEGFEINSHGQIIPSDRTTCDFDAAAIYKQVQAKKLSIDDFLACIKSGG